MEKEINNLIKLIFNEADGTQNVEYTDKNYKYSFTIVKDGDSVSTKIVRIKLNKEDQAKAKKKLEDFINKFSDEQFADLIEDVDDKVNNLYSAGSYQKVEEILREALKKKITDLTRLLY